MSRGTLIKLHCTIWWVYITCSLHGCKELVPTLHDFHECIKADFCCTSHQPAHHFTPTPVQCGQGHPHYLKAHKIHGLAKCVPVNFTIWRASSSRLNQLHQFVHTQVYRLHITFTPPTCSPSSKAAFNRGMCRGPSAGVAILNASWASLNSCEELWILRCAESRTVLSLITSPVHKAKGKTFQIRKTGISHALKLVRSWI